MLQYTKFVTIIIDLNITDPINCKNLLYPPTRSIQCLMLSCLNCIIFMYRCVFPAPHAYSTLGGLKRVLNPRWD